MPNPTSAIIPPSNELTGPQIHRALSRFVRHLEAHEAQINDLNVFPVPDGDTGTNSLLTAQAGLESITGADHSDLGWVVATFAAGCGMGARGNSGVILSEYMRGLSDGLGATANADAWSSALANASSAAFASVSDPKKGTMLTVARKVTKVEPADSILKFTKKVDKKARKAVLKTTDQMAELAAAGVVDSGAFVLSLFHDAVFEEVSGKEMPELSLAQRTCDVSGVSYTGPAYEVMFFFEGTEEQMASVRSALAGIGESFAATGIASPWNVHVHVDDPSSALALSMRHGRVYRITVSSLVDDAAYSNTQREQTSIGVVMVCHGSGIATLAAESGAVVLHVPPRTSPSTAEFVKAISRANAQHVIVLPSDADAQGSAELAVSSAARRGLTATVVPTHSTVQSLAALAICDPHGDIDQVLPAMSEAAADTSYGAVTIAQRSSLTTAGPCSAGDVLGLIRGKIAAVSSDGNIEAMASRIVDELMTETSDLVTVIYGSDAHGHAELEHRITASHPSVDVVMYDGGQPHWPYLIGVE